jgi:hypothetical protein
MIDWNATKGNFGYGAECVKNAYRPKVICRCDLCNKERIVTIRVKSRVVENQIDWKCPACIGQGLSEKFSESTKQCWLDSEYRSNQVDVKKSGEYLENQRKMGEERWEDSDYREKFKSITNDEYIERAIKANKELFDYSETIFINWKNKIDFKCNLCGNISQQSPYNHLTIPSCKFCSTSSGQLLINDHITSLGYETVINDRTSISPLEIDIYIPELKFGIEYHGYYWHSYNKQETVKERKKHQDKALLAIKNNISLKQFYCFEWNNQKDLIKSMIGHYLGRSSKLHARKCGIIEISESEANLFFSANHLQGHRPARHYLALIFNKSIVGAVSISKTKGGCELIRMAFKNGSTVIGGGSRLINNAMKLFKISNLFTFADLRYSTGNVYKKIGFKELCVTKPNYKYVTKSEILSRQRCQKHRLSRMLGELFDPNLTESQNMFNAGYRRLWDAGNIKMVKHGE